jgi:hypothetical protein
MQRIGTDACFSNVTTYGMRISTLFSYCHYFGCDNDGVAVTSPGKDTVGSERPVAVRLTVWHTGIEAVKP